MKIIEGIDSALIYISKYLKDDKSKLESNGNGLFEENYPPELFARNIIKIIKEQGDYGLKRITNHLEQNENISFREAYKISAKLVNYAEKKRKKLNELSLDEIKKVKNNLKKDVMKVFNVRNSVDFKTSYGGTSTKNIKKMISKLKKELK